MKVYLMYLKPANSLRINCTENNNNRDLYDMYCLTLVYRRAL